VFLINSRYRHFSATPSGSRSKSLHPVGAHLLPKLRCQFAEFLSQSSLTRLRILSSPTCVGLRYVHLVHSLEDFLGSVGSIASVLKRTSSSRLGVLVGTRLFLRSPPTRLNRDVQCPADLPSCVPPSVQTRTRWYRNINLFPISYACRPRIRVSTHPGRTNLPQETLGFRRAGFSPALSLLMSA
jgi:hypothetical protein